MRVFKKYSLVFVALIFGVLAVFLQGIPNVSKTYAASDFAKGDGTADSPYEIVTLTDFFNVRFNRSDYFIQKNDLDFSGYGKSFLQIGSVTSPFDGNYNGNGFKIKNIVVGSESSSSDFAGLFACVRGYVYNLHIEDSSFFGKKNVGAIAGANCGTIYNCSVTNSAINGEYNAGGIVGLNSDGTVQNCFNKNSDITLSNGYYAGGIVGNNNSEIFNCYNTGLVTADHTLDYVGGIAGLNSGENSSIKNTHNFTAVSGNIMGGVAGYNNGKIESSVWLENEDYGMDGFHAENSEDNVFALEAEEFKNGASFDGFSNLGDDWQILPGADYPTLKVNTSMRFEDKYTYRSVNVNKKIIVKDALTLEVIDNAFVNIDNVPRYTDREGSITTTIDRDCVGLIVGKDGYIQQFEVLQVFEGDYTVFLRKPSYDIKLSGLNLSLNSGTINLLENNYIVDTKVTTEKYDISLDYNVDVTEYKLYANDAVIASKSTNSFEDIDFSEFTNADKFYVQAVYRGIASEKELISISIKAPETPVITPPAGNEEENGTGNNGTGNNGTEDNGTEDTEEKPAKNGCFGAANSALAIFGVVAALFIIKRKA